MNNEEPMSYIDWMKFRDRLWIWGALVGALAVIAGFRAGDPVGFWSNLLAELTGLAFTLCAASIILQKVQTDRNRMLRRVKWNYVVAPFEQRLRYALVGLAVSMLRITGKTKSDEEGRALFTLGNELQRHSLNASLRRAFSRSPLRPPALSDAQANLIARDIPAEANKFKGIWTEFAIQIRPVFIASDDYDLLTTIASVEERIRWAEQLLDPNLGYRQHAQNTWFAAHSLLFCALRTSDMLDLLTGARSSFDDESGGV